MTATKSTCDIFIYLCTTYSYIYIFIYGIFMFIKIFNFIYDIFVFIKTFIYDDILIYLYCNRTFMKALVS